MGALNEVIEESGSRYFRNVRKAEIHFEDYGRDGDGDAIG